MLLNKSLVRTKFFQNKKNCRAVMTSLHKTVKRIGALFVFALLSSVSNDGPMIKLWCHINSKKLVTGIQVGMQSVSVCFILLGVDPSAPNNHNCTVIHYFEARLCYQVKDQPSAGTGIWYAGRF